MKDTLKIVRASTGLSGRNLDAALKTAGISRYRLAKDLDISYRIVQYWAKGRRPSAAMAERVAAYLGIQTEPDRISALEIRLERIEARLGIGKEES
ncbi:MAG: helix-turn-helix domain-containing protein [Candidatus Aminicenantes bacterium]|nr:helix-turn-helix domain-containing protein [Candidatus Aminicenantes bacterium]